MNELIYHGLALMVCAGAGLFGVLYQLHHQAIESYHAVLRDRPLATPRSPKEQRHLQRKCDECSMVAYLATSHATFR